MSFNSVIVGALTVSMLHAILPDYRLTFVLVGSAQRWNRSKIMRLVFFTWKWACSADYDAWPCYARYIFLGFAHKEDHNHSFRSRSSNKATETSLFLMLSSYHPTSIPTMLFNSLYCGLEVLRFRIRW